LILKQSVILAATVLTFSIFGHSVAAQVCDAPLLASARGKVKFYPGHYVAIGSGETVAARFTNTLAEISDPDLNGNVIGIQKRYAWSDFNGPGQFQWHFDKLKNDIAEAARARKKLSVMIMFKFTNDFDASTVPRYIRDLPPSISGSLSIDPIYELNSGATFANGEIAHFGHPIVRRNFIRFLTKLAEVVDTDDTVTSVVLPESALGFKPGIAPYRSMTSTEFVALREAHIDGLLEIDKQASCIFKHTPFIQLTNYPEVKLPVIAFGSTQFSFALGGPDIWVNDPKIKPSYDKFKEVGSQVPIGFIAAGGNYQYVRYPDDLPESERPNYTFQAQYHWATNEVPSKTVIMLGEKARDLGANFVWWKRNGDSGDKYYRAFLEEVAKIGQGSPTIPALIRSCPRNYYVNGQGCTKLPLNL
jgi:hypothetical protein